MWSSTASTASTIRFDTDWAIPVESEILDKCIKDRDFFEPSVQLDNNFVFSAFKKKPKINILPKFNIDVKDYDPNKHVCLDALIKIWAKNSLYNDTRTLYEVYKNDKEDKQKCDMIVKNFFKLESPYYIPGPLNTVPFMDRLYVHPKKMCNLGWSVVSTKTIIEYVQQGILLFLIDLRFGTLKAHEKVAKHFKLARKRLMDGAYSTFGFAFLIHGRRLRLGLMYKNQHVFLDRDSTVILTSESNFSSRGTNNLVYVNFNDYIKILQVGDEIKIGPDIIVIVNGKTESSVVCTVKKDGIMKNRMDVIVPVNRRIEIKSDISYEEAADIELAINLGCDYLISPCVTRKLVEHINWVVAVRSRIVVILQMIGANEKLTKERIDHIFNISDGIYIYSDGKNEDPIISQYIVKEAFCKHKIIIRAGFLSKENALQNYERETLKHLLLYPDCIVFSPREYDVTKIPELIRSVYPEINSDSFLLAVGPICQQNYSLENVFCRYILQAIFINQIAYIIVVNNNGEFVRLLSKHRPLIPIIACFLDLPTARRCLISRNVSVIMYPGKMQTEHNDELTARLGFCRKYLNSIGSTAKDQKLLFCYESKPGLKYCDSVRILFD